MGSLAELDLCVRNSHEQELQQNAGKRTDDLSIRDLVDLGSGSSDAATKHATAESTTRLQLVQAWVRLVEAYQKNSSIFLESIKLLQQAFDFVSRAAEEDYRNLNTLVNLLTHTLLHHDRDHSTECRFVTLLEIMLSYRPNWQPSKLLSRFWVRIMQRIPADVTPMSFRRKAYRVLVSLSWVPSSQGLLEACSFDIYKQQQQQQQQQQQSLNDSGISTTARLPPPLRRAHLKRPLPRHDCVNQLLDRLKDETDVCVAISSRAHGTGKTTLAALVASHASIARVFSVLWLELGKDAQLTYVAYTVLLDQLIAQLNDHRRQRDGSYDDDDDDREDELYEPVDLAWPECAVRFGDDAAMRALRERACMERARDLVSDVLADDNVLLVLDNVAVAADLEWFRFNERQSLIVTTADPDLETVDWTVHLDPMSEEEAAELFVQEADVQAGNDNSLLLASTKEVRRVVQVCQCHPLTVRSAARWFQLKSVTAGMVRGMDELLHELDTFELGNEDGDDTDEAQDELSSAGTPKVFLELLLAMLSPARMGGTGSSMAFTLCLAAMAVVFPDPVPLDPVLLLWEELMRCEPRLVDEQRQNPARASASENACFIAEGLVHMGILDVVRKKDGPWLHFHHRMYLEFAMLMAREMDLAETYETTQVQWQKAFVSAYFAKRIKSPVEISIDENSWKYALRNLPQHMFEANLVSMAESILSDAQFFAARLDCLGWESTIDVQIKDCASLQKNLDSEEEPSSESLMVASSVFVKMARMVDKSARTMTGSSEESLVIDISRAYFKIGSALAELRHYEEAKQQFISAQKLLPQSQELRASILYGSAWTLLELNEGEKALKKIKACRKLMEDMQDEHPLYHQVLQLQSDIYESLCEYTKAIEILTVVVQNCSADSSDDAIDQGVALMKRGCLYHTMGLQDEAKQALADCVACKANLSDVSCSMANAYGRLADVCIDMRHIAEAREHLETAIGILDTLQIKMTQLDYLLIVGKLRYLRNDFTSSLKALSQARSMILASSTIDACVAAYSLRCIARIFSSQGDAETSFQILSESLELTGCRPFSLERSHILLELGNSLLDQGEIKRGLTYLEQSLEIRVLKLGECVQILDTLKAIGKVHLSLNEFDEALKVFKKIQEVVARVAPNDVVMNAEALLAIGDVLNAKGHYHEAVSNYTACLELLRCSLSGDHVDVARALQRLGDAYSKCGELDNAQKHYLEALRIRKMHFDSSALAETLHGIGVLLRRRARYDDAHEYVAEALELCKQSRNDVAAAESMFEVGNLFRLQSEPERAFTVYKKASERTVDEVMKNACMLAMGHCALAVSKDDEALHFYRHAYQGRAKAFGKEHVKTGNAMRSLGIAQYLMGRGELSLINLNGFINLCESSVANAKHNNNKEHDSVQSFESLGYAVAITLLGDINDASGKQEQARNLWSIAKDVCLQDKDVTSKIPSITLIITRRLEGCKKNPRNGRGLFARLTDSPRSGGSEEAAPKIELSVDPEDSAILRQIQFVDD